MAWLVLITHQTQPEMKMLSYAQKMLLRRRGKDPGALERVRYPERL